MAAEDRDDPGHPADHRGDRLLAAHLQVAGEQEQEQEQEQEPEQEEEEEDLQVDRSSHPQEPCGKLRQGPRQDRRQGHRERGAVGDSDSFQNFGSTKPAIKFMVESCR